MATGKLAAYSTTGVSPGRTMEELERVLDRAGVVAKRWTTYADTVRLEFQPERGGEAFRIDVPVPSDRNERKAEQLRRQAYRLLYWYVKSKLEAIENGISDFRREFLPYMITGPETTFIHHVEGAIERGERSLPLGQDSPLLPPGRGHGQGGDTVEGEVIE